VSAVTVTVHAKLKDIFSVVILYFSAPRGAVNLSLVYGTNGWGVYSCSGNELLIIAAGLAVNWECYA